MDDGVLVMNDQRERRGKSGLVKRETGENPVRTRHRIS